MSMYTESVKFTTHSGIETHNTLYKHENRSNKLLIILPGQGYSCDYPTLYYLRQAALQLGYDVFCIEYGFQAAHANFEFGLIPELIDDLQEIWQVILSSGYAQVCIAGKSLGTLLAVHLAPSVCDSSVSLILLTPIGDCVQSLGGLRTLAVIGTGDPLYDAELVETREDSDTIQWLVLDGLDHALEFTDDWRSSLIALSEIIDACVHFLA